jgi:hypothetical protein
MVLIATLSPPVLWRAQGKVGEISFHDIMAHSYLDFAQLHGIA